MAVKVAIYLFSMLLFFVMLYMVGSVWFRGKRGTYLNLFFALGILHSLWALTNGFNVMLGEAEYVTLYPISMLMLSILPSVLLRYILYFTESRYAKSRAVSWVLTVLPAVDALMIVTNAWHHQIIDSYEGLRPIPGPLFPVHALISYLPVLAAVILLFRYVIKNMRKTPSLLIVAAGVLLPLISNIMYTFGIFRSDFDITPVTFLIMFSVFAVYSIRLRLFDIKETAFTGLFVSLSDAFLVVDNAGHVADANPAFKKTFSAGAGALERAEDILAFLDSIAAERSPADLFDTLRTPEAEIHEAEITVSRDGETHHYSVSKDVIKERGQFAGYIMTLADISNYRQMIDEINAKNSKLTELKNLAETASTAKSEFLSRMSHEIRTPMNAIIGMTKIADNTDDIEKLKYCLSTIEASSAQLLNLINDILDMSKIEAGKFELDAAPMDIESMLTRVCNLVADKAKQKDQRLVVNIGANMCKRYIGDELRLSQVVTNLLSNAVKFTPEHGTIKVAVDETHRDERESVLCFSVSDSGIGMSEEQMGRLFKSFEQADGSITRRFGGTGLGLAISKSIIEKMNGNIYVQSELNEGSEFTFEVRLERAAEGGKAEPATTQPVEEGPVDLSNVTLLLAEDVEINREIFIALLEDTGVQIEVAENGLIAVQKFQDNPSHYNIIVMDVQMPEMDGYEATRVIRALDAPNAASIPIIAMTANAFKEDVDKCIACGMNDHLAKPIDVDAVLQKLTHYLR